MSQTTRCCWKNFKVRKTAEFLLHVTYKRCIADFGQCLSHYGKAVILLDLPHEWSAQILTSLAFQ